MSSFIFYDTDSDEETNRNMALERQMIRDRSNPLEIPDALFQKYFRLNKDAFQYLLAIVTANTKITVRSSSVPPILKLAAALRFFADGGYQTGTGNDFVAELGQATFSINLKEILDICERVLCPEMIKFPSSDEQKQNIKLSFYNKFGFPGIIGCVDGTHVKIVAPPKDVRHLYYNRKGYYSLNVMIVCDDSLVISYVDGNHPGSCHDSFIFNSSELDSELQQKFENGAINTWLLGDSVYTLKPYVIVPFRNTQEGDLRKKDFNKKHCKVRNIVERTIGVLKNRFRCILGERQLRYSPNKARQIVNVCCALHNLCLRYNVNFDEPVIPVDEEDLLAPPEGDDHQNAGERIRLSIMNSIC